MGYDAVMTVASRRKTQQERSAAMQAKIIEATITCLVEHGYNRFTTTLVCQAAGCSQGAIFKHFPTKAILVVHAIDSLYSELVDQYREMVRSLPDDADRVGESLQQLRTLFQQPRLLVVYDLHTAARTDLELRQVLAPKERAHRASIRELALEIFPEMTGSPVFASAIDVLFNVVQGAAIGSLVLVEPDIHAQRMAMLDMVARQLLEAARVH